MEAIKRIFTETIYKGKRVTVEKAHYDEVHPMEHVIVTPASAILPITKEGKIVLVKQTRTAVGDKVQYEIPAGLIDKTDGDDKNLELQVAKKAAIRELQEETGYIANDADFITMANTSPGFTNEQVYIFITNELSGRTVQHLDESENIEVYEVELEKAMEMISTNDISNIVTIAALYWLKANK